MTISAHSKITPFAIVAASVFVSILIVGQAWAQTDAPASGEASVSFPVAELGNCTSKADCKRYCDQPDNMEACISFAEKNNLMPQEDIAMAKKFLAAGSKGPGGCTSKDSCEAFCNDINNMDACVSFAEQSGMMSPKELDEAKKVQAAIKRGIKPPACGGKKACDAYCEESNHIEECITFASAAGFMSPEEQANAQKMVQAIKSGVKPLPCRGKEECDAYCGQEQNIDACVAFAEAAGFMSKDDASMARKTRGKGPGGCTGKDSCEAFCNNPENQETCFNFGRDNGLIPPEELQKMEERDRQFRNSLSGIPPEVASCLENALGKDNADKLMSGAMRPTRELGDKMSVCFSQGEERRVQGEEQDGRRGQESFGPQGPGERGDYPFRGPSEMQGRAPFNGGQFPPNGPNNFEGQRPGSFDEGRPPYDPNNQPTNYQPQPRTGEYPCQGDNCPLPPAGSQLQQMQQGVIQQMQQFNAPGSDVPPPGDTSGGIPPPTAGSILPPPSDGGVAPVEAIAPAPIQEPAPASGPAGAAPSDIMGASVFTALFPFLFQRQ